MVSRLVRTFRRGNRVRGVLVGGSDNLMVRFAKCCNPIPGDPIVGFITRGRGISIHRTDCPNVPLFAEDEERRIQVSWDQDEAKKFTVSLQITAGDRPGLLHEVSEVFSGLGVNVVDGRIRTRGQQASAFFTIEISNKSQLKQIFRRIQKVKGIEKIVRTKETADFSEKEDV